ncbi:MAG: hypothetical protein EOP49_05735 [Sphingobacteriales bacterium]|nr:MAG: hypothetical protein EOP49_05735 [Sphingobacteriales bacterium]
MKEHTLKDLLEKTFDKLACPAKGHGMYSELEKALIEAYNMGKAQQEAHHMIKPKEELMYAFFRA